MAPGQPSSRTRPDSISFLRVRAVAVHYVGQARRRWVRSSLRRRLITVRAWTTWKHRRFLRTAGLSGEQQVVAANACSVISPDDLMYTGDASHYWSVAMSAIEEIDFALAAAGSRSRARILDFPCGGGRVLRVLRTRFPGARIVASDLDERVFRFCSKTFPSVDLKPSRKELAALDLGEVFDLIWCGSLITHLDDAGLREALAFFGRHLERDGLLVVSTHGQAACDRLSNGRFDYGLSQDQNQRLRGLFESTGFGYVDYTGSSSYGVSLVSRDWLRKFAQETGWEVVSFRPHGWDHHHDVYGLRRVQR